MVLETIRFLGVLLVNQYCVTSDTPDPFSEIRPNLDNLIATERLDGVFEFLFVGECRVFGISVKVIEKMLVLDTTTSRVLDCFLDLGANLTTVGPDSLDGGRVEVHVPAHRDVLWNETALGRCMNGAILVSDTVSEVLVILVVDVVEAVRQNLFIPLEFLPGDHLSSEFPDTSVRIYAGPLLRRYEYECIIELAFLARREGIELLIVCLLILLCRKRYDDFQRLVIGNLLFSIDWIEDVDVIVTIEQILGDEPLDAMDGRVLVDVFGLLLDTGRWVLVGVEGILAVDAEDVPRVSEDVFSERSDDFMGVLAFSYRPHEHLVFVRPFFSASGKAVKENDVQ